MPVSHRDIPDTTQVYDMKTRPAHPETKTRRGFQTLELLFVLPLVLVLFVAALQYGRASVIQSAMTQAATVASREAGKGADVQDIARAVNGVLAPYGIEIDDSADSGLKIVLQDGCGQPTQYGDPNWALPEASSVQPDEVLTSVCMKFSARRRDGSRIVADTFGLLEAAFRDGQFCVCSLVKKQDLSSVASLQTSIL
jgi:hypothetical protein